MAKGRIIPERNKKKELRSPEYYESHRRLLEEMLQYACDQGNVRLSSGLVEQQRLFKKLDISGRLKEDNI